MHTFPKRPRTQLWPSEVATLGVLHALEEGKQPPRLPLANAGLEPPFADLPERNRLFRLVPAVPDPPVVDSSVYRSADPARREHSHSIEVIYPIREGRSPAQIGRTEKSNHRWIVGRKLCRLVNHHFVEK
jgi:hypothetical protein